MNINDYFTPVALDKKDAFFVPDKNSLISNIKINTPNSPIEDLSGIKLAIMGIPESRNSHNNGSEKAPDAIRNKLYQLKNLPESSKKKILDLGNLKAGKVTTDTYFGIKEVTSYLLERNILPVLLGGTQDNTIGGTMAMNSLNIPVYLTTIDSRIDYSLHSESPKSISYLSELLENSNHKIDEYLNIGHQTFLNDPHILEKFYQLQYDCIRLGEAKQNIQELEPLLRDTTFLSLDISSIKQGDAPGNYNPSPNGFVADEACVLSRYAGLSENMKLFGIFELNPAYDNNAQSSHLAAQILWYFIDGYFNRYNELPEENNGNYKKFIVGLNKSVNTLTFYKSQKSNRWWLKVNDNRDKEWIACSYKDYQTACSNDIPNRWLKFNTKNK